MMYSVRLRFFLARLEGNAFFAGFKWTPAHNDEVSGIVGTYDSVFLSFLLSAIFSFAFHHCLWNRKFWVSNLRTAASKRKKARKSGKNSGSADKNDKLISSENDDGQALGDSNKLLLLLIFSVIFIPDLCFSLSRFKWTPVHDDEVSGILGTSDSYALVSLLFLLGGLFSFALGFYVLNAKFGDSKLRTAASKRKKARNSGKNSGSADKNDKLISSENDDGHALGDDSNKLFTDDLNRLVDCGADGRTVGKLFVTNTEIAKGSNGTIVFEGIHEGRPVAVKRLVRAYHDVAFKEIQNLIVSDTHPNIVRWYGVESDQDFVYLALERCSCSLDDLIQICLDPSFECNLRLDSVKSTMQDLNLWKANGHPSPLLLKLMRDIVSGLVHLHELGIIHRDLKPQNVLIISEGRGSLCAKISDMGISRCLLADKSSLSNHATGCGSSGWQAPEQLIRKRQTPRLDLFSLGCVLYFCIARGQHPFGRPRRRDINIEKNKVNLSFVDRIPEAKDLISHLLNPDPQLRPPAFGVLHHPLFWSSEKRLSFVRDTSDRIELEDNTSSALLKALEDTASVALGTKWNEKMEKAFIKNIGCYRHYSFDSVKDLLRVMRNKLNHYRDLPEEIQELVGPVPEGFDKYFASRFPRLLIEVYKVVCRFCREEECYQKYFKSDIL